jgi:tetratricopeptide (TPR) repeat protein
LALRLGDCESALDFYRKAAEAAPGDEEIYRGMAACEAALGRLDLEAVYLRKVLDLDPGDGQAAAQLEQVRKRLPGLAGTGQTPSDNPPQKAVLKPEEVKVLHRANQLYLRGHYDEALESYEDLVHRQPATDDGWYGIGACQYVKGNFEAARQALQEALRRNPSAGLPAGLLEVAQEELTGRESSEAGKTDRKDAHLEAALRFLYAGRCRESKVELKRIHPARRDKTLRRRIGLVQRELANCPGGK